MDEIWERAVETALDGQTDVASVRTLTLDGAVKCVHGRLPAPSIFEKFQNLEHLSIANIGVSSLEQFPRLQNLQKLILSDNRIAGGLEYLVEAGLESLRDLDLSNNRIQEVDDLRPLAELKLVSLDLYECPVTRIKDYRSRVFGLIKSLRYLDKMDADENERPESDDDEEEDEEGEEEEEDDPGSGEVDGEDRPNRMTNGHTVGQDGVVYVDEDEESDADEEETEIVRDGGNHQNGFRVEAVGEEEENEDEEEIDEEDDDDDDVVEVHQVHGIDDTDDEDGVEDEEDDDDDEEEEDDDEEVDNDEVEFAEMHSGGGIPSAEGEIDAHEQGEEDGDDEDDNGETGEEEIEVEEDEEYEEEEEEDAEDEWQEEDDTGYLVQRAVPVEDAGGSDMDAENEEDDDGNDAVLEEEVEDDDEDDDGEVQVLPPPSSSVSHKRKRDADDSDGDGGGDDEEDDDGPQLSKSPRSK